MSLLSIDLSVHLYNYGIFDTIRVHCGFLSKERKTKQFFKFFVTLLGCTIDYMWSRQKKWAKIKPRLQQWGKWMQQVATYVDIDFLLNHNNNKTHCTPSGGKTTTRRR